MSLSNPRKAIKRYRADNPYSHALLFISLEFLVGSFKVLFVCVALGAIWVVGNGWMKDDQQKPFEVVAAANAKAAVIEASKIEKQPVLVAKVERADGSDKVVWSLTGGEWILEQKRGSYTLQVGTSPDKGKLISFAMEVLAKEHAHIYAFKVSSIGNPIYGLSFGLFPDLKSAQESIKKLPPAYREFDPWIRPIGELQDQIKQVKKQLKPLQ